MKLALSAAVATITSVAAFSTSVQAQDIKNLGYVVDQNSVVVISGLGECVRSGLWTPALAAAAAAVKQCTPDLAPKAAAAPAPKAAAAAPKAAPQPAPKAAPKAEPARPPLQTINFAADALFDFDKAELKSEGKAKLDELPRMLQGVKYEVIQAIGHTDRIGSAKYNQQLSVKRAEAVKKYLVDKGVEPGRIRAEGRGKTQPLTKPDTCKGKQNKALIACLQPDRRVAVVVTGTK